MEPFTPKFTITNRITAALTQIERARGFLEAATLSDEWIREMATQALIKEAHYTTHIEGTKLSLDEAQKIWNYEDVSIEDPNDKIELLNYRSAFDFVSKSVESSDPITERLIRTIHFKLVEGVRGGNAAPGEYRRIQNYVVNTTTGEVIYTPPPAGEIPAMMSQLVKWVNTEQDIHPVLVSGIAQFQLVHIHPFLDGNGRASRLLSTLYLYKTGYDFKRLFTISEYYDRNRQAFYDAIQKTRDNGLNLTGWLEYFITGLETQMLEVKERGQQVIKRDLFVQKYNLNQRQSKILYLCQQLNSFTVFQLEKHFPSVSKRTLQRDLKKLQDLQLLTQTGATNQLLYQAKI